MYMYFGAGYRTRIEDALTGVGSTCDREDNISVSVM